MLLALIFVGIFGGSCGAALWLRRSSEVKVRQRLLTICQTRPDAAEKPSTDLPLIALNGSQPVKGGQTAWIPKMLRDARSSWTEAKFLAVSGALAVLASALAFLFTSSLGIVAATGFAAGCMPIAWLRYRRAKRLKMFNECLPDAIDMMSRALQAGHSVQQMIQATSEQVREPVRGELAQVPREQKLGVPMRDALLALTKRVPSQDLRFVVTAMLIQKDTGGDLIVILERTSHVIRERLRVAAEVRTYTAQGRMTGWVLTALPVLLLGVVSLITPSYAKVLFQDPTGQRLLSGGAVMLLIGGLLIRKVTKIEV